MFGGGRGWGLVAATFRNGEMECVTRSITLEDGQVQLFHTFAYIICHCACSKPEKITSSFKF